jgi:S-adenosylmethionine:tRNA ribosyltransferase-isomerase
MRKQGKRPLLAACDIYRPAAIKQLETVGAQLDIPVFQMGQTNPVDIAKAAIEHAKKHGNDLVFLDTAGRLHIDAQLMDELKEKGIDIKYLTLHVGLGTFLPIRSDKVEEHHMHSEWFHIPEETLKAIEETKKAGHKVVAVGTTVTRTLEFYAKTGKTEGEDDIFIYPGFKFQIVDALLTNFHAPKSTVLMLASAFAGWKNLKPAYEHAVESGYKLLSYGDSMLIK